MLWLGGDAEKHYLCAEKGSPGVHRMHPPGPLGKDRGLPAAAPLTAAAPVTTTVAIGTLLLRPSFIHDQGPSRKL